MPLAAFTTTPALPPLLSCLSFLICSSHPRRSLPARSHSSRPATAQVPLLTVVSLTDNISSDRRPSLLVNSLHRHSTVMVRCACTTSTIDRGCTNTPQTCYQCCTTHPTIFTCQHHYRQMGNIDANARLARGLVHPSIAAGAPVPGEPEPAPQGDIALQPIAHDPPAAALNVDPLPAPGPGPAPDAAAALAGAAWRAEVDADRAATAVDRAAAVAESAALRRQLSEQAHGSILAILDNIYLSNVFELQVQLIGTRCIRNSSSYTAHTALAPIATLISCARLALSAIPAHRCTAMAMESTR